MCLHRAEYVSLKDGIYIIIERNLWHHMMEYVSPMSGMCVIIEWNPCHCGNKIVLSQNEICTMIKMNLRLKTDFVISTLKLFSIDK